MEVVCINSAVSGSYKELVFVDSKLHMAFYKAFVTGLSNPHAPGKPPPLNMTITQQQRWHLKVTCNLEQRACTDDGAASA